MKRYVPVFPPKPRVGSAAWWDERLPKNRLEAGVLLAELVAVALVTLFNQALGSFIHYLFGR